MPNDRLEGKYVLKCTHEGCHGELVTTFNHGERIAVGQVFQRDTTDATRGRCPVCKRHKMQVVSAPALPTAPGPKGFSKVPTR